MATDVSTDEQRLAWSLFLLRAAVFVVMALWSLDKLVAPEHAAAVFANFYFITGLPTGVLVLLGLVQLAIEVGFLLGIAKFWTYGAVLVFHSISTLASFRQYLDPFENLLFFAAWPMLAACVALFLLRDQDRLFTLDYWRFRAKAQPDG
jgi:putative oxidoreductase